MRAGAVLTACLALTAAAGCGQDPDELVAMRVRGGFAGVDHRLSIARDGRAAIDYGRGGPRRRFRVPAGRLRRAEAALDAAGFTRLRLPDLPCRAMADGFSYTITYRGRTRRGGTGCERGGLDRAFAELGEIASPRPRSDGGRADGRREPRRAR